MEWGWDGMGVHGVCQGWKEGEEDIGLGWERDETCMQEGQSPSQASEGGSGGDIDLGIVLGHPCSVEVNGMPKEGLPTLCLQLRTWLRLLMWRPSICDFFSAFWTFEHWRERLQTSGFLGIKFSSIHGENIDMYQKYSILSKHIEVKLYLFI